MDTTTIHLAGELVKGVANWALSAGLGALVPDVSADLDGRLFLSWRSGGYGVVTSIVSGTDDCVVVVETREGRVPERMVCRPDRATSSVFRAVSRLFVSQAPA